MRTYFEREGLRFVGTTPPLSCPAPCGCPCSGWMRSGQAPPSPTFLIPGRRACAPYRGSAPARNEGGVSSAGRRVRWTPALSSALDSVEHSLLGRVRHRNDDQERGAEPPSRIERRSWGRHSPWGLFQQLQAGDPRRNERLRPSGPRCIRRGVFISSPRKRREFSPPCRPEPPPPPRGSGRRSHPPPFRPRR